MAIEWPSPKDPDETLDFQIDWSTRLDTGDTIVTSTWIIPDGLTKQSDGKTTNATTVWLMGGTAGTSYLVLNRVVTANGRTLDQTGKLKVKDK